MKDLAGFEAEASSALATPLARDLELRIDCLEELVYFRLTNGVRGFFILGTYGEGISIRPKK